jgi:ABC-2 type transport system ATP-binding protein
MTGLVRPDSGRLLYRGEVLAILDSGFRAQIGLVSQHENLDLDLSPRENLHLHGLLYGLAGTRLRPAVDLWLERAGLGRRGHEPTRNLSGGMKRKLQIARAMMHEPSMLILDEPTVGLDPVNREDVWALIAELRSEGRAILFSTHYMDEAQVHADEVSIIDRGRLVLEGVPADIIGALGVWCTISYEKGRQCIRFHAERPSPAWSDGEGEELSIRRTSLHEVFLSFTGRSL